MNYKLILSVFILLFVSSCKIDDGLDCSLVDCAAGQVISLEFLNSEGTNLISNGTYSLEDIEVTVGTNKLELIEFDADKLVTFFLSEKQGETTYNINFKALEITDTLVLNLTQTSTAADCCGPYFQINSATYNGESQEIVQMEFGFEKIVIVK